MDTKQVILDTAERLFAQNGIDATSLRTITSEADVNLASVNYHYGSKEILVQEVFRRRFIAVNEERLKLLAECQAKAGSGTVPVEKILEALLGPMVRLCLSTMDKGYSMASLMHRAFNESNENLVRFIMGEMRDVIEKFSEALGRSLPELDPQEVHWRLHFAIGATAHSLLVIPRIMKVLECKDCSKEEFNDKTLLRHLIPYIAGGFRTPPVKSE